MKKLKIAIADDHNVSLSGMKAILNCLDYIEVVIEASNGKELIEKLKNTVPDIILMDVQMPIINGIEATKEIARTHPFVKIIGVYNFYY
jgi:two-component system, NarL family, response regulator DegU